MFWHQLYELILNTLWVESLRLFCLILIWSVLSRKKHV